MRDVWKRVILTSAGLLSSGGEGTSERAISTGVVDSGAPPADWVGPEPLIDSGPEAEAAPVVAAPKTPGVKDCSEYANYADAVPVQISELPVCNSSLHDDASLL